MAPQSYIDAAQKVGGSTSDGVLTPVGEALPDWADDEWAIARATKCLIDEAPEAVFGAQHNAIVAMVQKCGDFGVTPSTAAGLISEHWIETKSETATPEEVERIAASIKVRQKPFGCDYGVEPMTTEEIYECLPGVDVRPESDSKPLETRAKRFELQRWTPTDPSAIAPREWLYGKYLIREFVSITSAPGGLGKSSLALVEAVAMATGLPLLGVKPFKQMNVAYWNGEDPRDEIARRVVAVAKHYGIDQTALAERFFFGSGREMGLKLATMRDGSAVIAMPIASEVIDFLLRNEIDALLIDPFISCHSVKENDNDAMDAVVKE